MRKVVISGLVVVIITTLLIIIFQGEPNSEEVQDADLHNEDEGASEEDEESKLVDFEYDPSDFMIRAYRPLMRSDIFEEDGEGCYEVDEVIERGDCFLEVINDHLSFDLNYDQTQFYFPIQQERDDWEDVFYFEVGDEGDLVDLELLDYAEEYEDEFAGPQDDLARGKETLMAYWYVFSSVIPNEFRPTLERVYWLDAQEQQLLAIYRPPDDSEILSLVLSQYVGDYDTPVKVILIHEFGHYLTLNSSEIDYSNGLYEDDPSLCEEYLTVYGCAKEDSYMNQFVGLFWSDLLEEYEAIDWSEESDDYREFFEKNENHFFNTYQGTAPEEDIAESFAFFVFLDSDRVETGDRVKYDKVSFFYQFDELVELRTEILENFYNLSLEDGNRY
ncbi:hypothetical protein [Alkalibacillus haloalkaliphilus]|uniref:Uncharacterized protein n=1 Tax=Alkalibacillus haloalkaliphilus TaxID=94136 RepID=A0A511W9A9_9BACI|nr:hypothetical protein [Alkalibacillus haloalkaliphilus]GEN45922.1 hypothetical protein AHA02nite_16980 [Alkalibacillus haloalkaliphilus]